MWQLLLLLGAGVGIYTLSKEEEKKDDKKEDSKKSSSTWKEKLKDYVYAEGQDYALTEYDWRRVKNQIFQDALKNYKTKKKALQTAIKGLPNAKKQYVEDVIDKEGFDTAFIYYSDFDQYTTQLGVSKRMDNEVFEKARKEYVTAFKRIQKIIK